MNSKLQLRILVLLHQLRQLPPRKNILLKRGARSSSYQLSLTDWRDASGAPLPLQLAPKPPFFRWCGVLQLALLFALFLLGAVQPCFADYPIYQKQSFVFVIPSYNNKDWYKLNLDSVFSQSYDNYRVIYIDDASTDHTGSLVKDYIQENQQEDRVTLIQNKNRVGALANIYRAISLCSPDEIVVNLDGDDWLAHDNVLEHLNKVYANRDIWLTYGQFMYYPSYERGIGEEIPMEVIQNNSFRSFTRGTTALRTFYAGLFHQIKKEDLLYQGDFFQAGYDLAIMLPMLEMAGDHIKFIPEVSYIYNINTAINDFKVRLDEQAEVDRMVRRKQKYLPVTHYNNQRGPVKKVYITTGYLGQLFDIDNPVYNRDNSLEVTYKLRAIAADAGYEILQADSVEALQDFEYLVVFDVFLDQIQYLDRYPKEKLILFLWEPPSVKPENYNPEYHRYFSKVFTWDDRIVDSKKYFKFYYPVLRPVISDPVDFDLKRLCVLIACNKSSPHPMELYSERLKVIQFFETFHQNDFELYGKGWPLFKTYQGPILKKLDYLKYYKFCFTYENIKNIPGYITEKIFDAFQAGCVPIYWGAPNIEDYIPKNCFIAREDFADEHALYRFLKEMPSRDYCEYQKNIRMFLETDKAQLYSIDYFIHNFMEMLSTPPNKTTEDL